MKEGKDLGKALETMLEVHQSQINERDTTNRVLARQLTKVISRLEAVNDVQNPARLVPRRWERDNR